MTSIYTGVFERSYMDAVCLCLNSFETVVRIA